MRATKSSLRATTISAAADGVGARRSATKSAIVTSVSWPTAEIVGTGQPAIARATTSSLKAQRSSIEPPPRPTMTTSTPLHLGDRPEPARDVERRAVALHARRPNHDVRVGVAAAQHLDDVAHGGAVERGDDADLAGQGRQRTLARLVEEAFGREPLLQLVEGELQRAEAFRLEVLADDLILALRVVDADAPARDDAQAVLRLEAKQPQRRAEHHALDLGRARPSA